MIRSSAERRRPAAERKPIEQFGGHGTVMPSMGAIACDGMRFALAWQACENGHYVVSDDAGRAVAIHNPSDRPFPRSFPTPTATYAAAKNLNRGGEKS